MQISPTPLTLAGETLAFSGPRKTLAANASGSALGAVVLALALFASAVEGDYGHDEEQYVAAGFLAMEAQVYRDFIYLQTPLYPELLARVFRLLSDGSRYFTISRLLTSACAMFTCTFLWGIAWRITGNHAVGLGTSLSFAGSTLATSGIATARNDISPAAVALAAIGLVLWTLHQGRFTRGQWHWRDDTAHIRNGGVGRVSVRELYLSSQDAACMV
jgi:hypothetical protein